MADVAQLAIEVDSSPVKGATSDLQKLTTASTEAETATKKLTDSSNQGASAQEVLRVKTRLSAEEIETAQKGTERFQAAQDKFYESLKRTAETMGKSRSEVAAYNAALLELGDDPAVQKYISQIKAAEDAQQAMKKGGLDLSEVIGNQMFRQLVRTGAYFAIMTVGIQGTISVIELLVNAGDHLEQALEASALAAGKNGEAATQLMDRFRQETDALKLMEQGSADAATQQQKLKSIKEEIAALGPEYANIVNNENLGIREQIALLAELNQKTKEKLQNQLNELTLKGPDDSFKTKAERTAADLLGIYGKIDPNVALIGNKFHEEDIANQTEAVTAWQKKIQDLRTEMAKLDAPSAYESELDKINSRLKEQQDALGKTAGQLVYEKEIRLGATEAVAQEAKRRQDAIDAAKGEARVTAEHIPLKERLIELLEREVGSQGRITSEAVAYQLSQQDLTKSDKERIATLVQQSAETERRIATEKEANQVFEDGNRIAKERDELEDRLTMAHEHYLQSVRQGADPGFRADQDYAKQAQALEELYNRGSLSAREYDRAIVKAKDDYVRLKAQGDDTLQALVDLTDTAAARMGKAFGQFATTGKLAFSDLVQSILADFAQLEAAKGFQEIAGYIEQALGAPSISYPDLSVGIPTGGSGYIGMDTSLPTLAPAPSLPPAAGGAGLVANTTINVSSGPSGPQATVETSGAQQNAQLGEKLRGAVLQVLIEQQRPGGVLNHA